MVVVLNPAGDTRPHDAGTPFDESGVVAAESVLVEQSDVLPVFAETAVVIKRRKVIGRVRVSTRAETQRTYAEATLDRNTVEVARVPVGRVVDSLPPVRNEGSTTIVPVVEERLVLVKQLFLVEELHISQEVKREAVRLPVELRRQRATVERLDVEGEPVEPGSTTPGEVRSAALPLPLAGTG